MAKRVYGLKGWKPKYMVFDNNCSLAKHVKGKDPFFDDIHLPVDVFHFKCKHAKSDEYCQRFCNPASFPDLIGEDGKGWFFNTSIAEQTNVWLGGFHSICREMTEDNFDFFLDEMIMMRNQVMYRRLRRAQVMIVTQ